MPELTDAQKVMRNDTGKSIAEAIANMSITVAGQEIEVSDTEPQSKFVDVWFQEQQQGTPVEVYTVPEVDAMREQMESNLAYINIGATADRLYNPGEYLVWNGQLYKVGDTAIGPGETLDPTPGSGNIEAISVMSDLTVPTQTALSLNTVVANADYGSYVEKIGNLKLCIIRIRMARNLTIDTLYDLATIPSNYAATYTHELNVPARNSANSNATAIFFVSGQQLQVKVVGAVSEYNYIAAIIPYI